MRARHRTGLRALAAAALGVAWAAGACRPLAPPEDVPGDGGTLPTVEASTITTIVVSDIKVTPDPNNALIATLTYTTSLQAIGTVNVTNTGDTLGINKFQLVETSGSTSHSVTLLGLRASSKFSIAITVTDPMGDSGQGDTTYTTGALPAGLPPVTVVETNPSMDNSGYTLMTVWGWDGSPVASVNPALSYVVAIDVTGQIVWYAHGIDQPGKYPVDAQQLPNGDILYITGDSGWAEIDMLGNVVTTSTASQLGLDSVHDFLFLQDGGTMLGLSTKLTQVPGYPSNGSPPPDAGPVKGGVTLPVVGDVAFQLGADGGVAQTWSTFDMLSPYVEGDFFNDPYWNALYADAGATKDWTHSNTIRDGTDPGTFLLSSAAQSWIVDFSGASGAPKVNWRLGPGGDFSLTTPNDTFQYNQTGISLLSDGDILCFDSGTFRVDADGSVPPLFSRAVEFSIDTTSMTASIKWQYEETPSFYSSFVGFVTSPDPGNIVLITDGGETANRISGDPTDPTNLKTARILEVTHDVSPTKFFEVDIDPALGSMPSDPTFSGYSVPRARRFKSLYGP